MYPCVQQSNRNIFMLETSYDDYCCFLHCFPHFPNCWFLSQNLVIRMFHQIAWLYSTFISFRCYQCRKLFVTNVFWSLVTWSIVFLQRKVVLNLSDKKTSKTEPTQRRNTTKNQRLIHFFFTTWLNNVQRFQKSI